MSSFGQFRQYRTEKSAAKFHYIKYVSGNVVVQSIAFRVVSIYWQADDPFPLKSWLQVTYPLLKAASFDTIPACDRRTDGRTYADGIAVANGVFTGCDRSRDRLHVCLHGAIVAAIGRAISRATDRAIVRRDDRTDRSPRRSCGYNMNIY